MNTAMLHTDGGFEHQAATMNRGDVLARYRHLRTMSKQHHSNALGFLARDAMLQQARRLGLARGMTFVLDSMDELALAFDLAIHTAPAGRSRAIDRYARSASLPPGSDEALMLEAMCGARFAIVLVRGRHPVAGLLVTDMFRKVDLWLMDEALEQSMPEGAVLATRYCQPADFIMTAGIIVPVDLALLEAAIEATPHLMGMPQAEAVADRRLAEAIYRAAIADGVMEGVSYQDVPGEHLDPGP